MLVKKSLNFNKALAAVFTLSSWFTSVEAGLSISNSASKGGGSYYSISQKGGELDGGAILWAPSEGMSVAEWSVVHTFDPDVASLPSGIPIEGSDGYLYGAALHGERILVETDILGEINLVETYLPGVLYKVRSNGAGFSVIHKFSQTEGQGLVGALAEISDPNGGRKLYGVAGSGGAFGGGLIYSVNTDGSGFQVLHDFAEGTLHSGGLSAGPNNILFGACRQADGANAGYLYWLYPAQNGLPSVFARYDFTDNTSISNPVFSPVFDGFNTIYLTCENGGDSQAGGILKVQLSDDPGALLVDSVSSFYSFTTAQGKPSGPMVTGFDGMGYVMTQGVKTANNSGSALQLDLETGTAFVIYNFKSGNHPTILYPFGRLELAPDGKIFGAYRGEPGAQGGLFQIDPVWSYQNRYEVVSVSPQNWTYDAALADAEVRGGHLATIGSAEESAEMLRQLGSTFVWNSYIGGTDLEEEGNWSWVTGEPWSYENWSQNEPNGGLYEGFAEILTSTQWNDIVDARRPYYILEYEELKRRAVASNSNISSLYLETGSGAFSVSSNNFTLEQGGVLKSAGGFSKLLNPLKLVKDLNGYADLPLDGGELVISITDQLGQPISSGVALSLTDAVDLPVSLQVGVPGKMSISFEAGASYRTLHRVLNGVYAEFSDSLTNDFLEVDVTWGQAQANPTLLASETLALVSRDYAPVLTSLPDKTVTLPAGTWDTTGKFPVVIALDIIDAETDLANLNITVDSSNQALLSDIQTNYDSLVGVWNLTLNPNSSVIGSSELTLKVTDVSGGQSAESFEFIVQAGPRFGSVEIPEFISTGDPAVFEVLSAEGSGELTYQWLKDGQEIAGATGSSFTVDSAGSVSSGLYSVRLTGDLGQVVSDAVLVQVIQSPVVTSMSESMFVQPGAAAEITVRFSGGGSLEAQWIFNASPMQVAEPGKLSIDEFSFENEGWYQLKVSNEVGEALSDPVFLQMNLSEYEIKGIGSNAAGQLDFLGDWSNVTDIAAGTDFTLGLTVDGQIKVAGNLPAFPGTSKKIMDIVAGDRHAIALLSDGTLVGWGSNSQGQITFGANLKDVVQVVAGIEYTAALTSQGDVLTFGALSGESSLSIRKIIGGSRVLAGITTENAPVLLAGSVSLLTPFPASLPDEVLDLALGDQFGVLVAANGELLTWGDDRFGLGQIPVTGQLDSLRGVSAGFYHAALISQSGNLFAWGAGSEGNSGWPHFGQSQFDDAWDGQRLAIGAFHSIFLVYVPQAPKISAPLSDFSELVGSTLSVGVEYTGDEPVSFQWEKSETATGPWLVVDGETNSSLEFPRLNNGDQGYYRVTLTNYIGSDFSVGQVIVLSPPSLVDEYQPIELSEPVGAAGLSLTAEQVVAGSGPFEYQWFLNDIAISDATGSVLEIDELAATDAGTYSVRVAGPGGEKIFIIGTVEAVAPPVITTITSDLTLKVGDLAEFQVTASGAGQLSYSWYKVNQATLQPINNQAHSVYTIPSVELSDTGDYVVRVTNVGGTVQSDPISLQALLIPSIQSVAMYEITEDGNGNEVEGLISDPASTPMAPGSRIRFKANVAGTDPLEFAWFKDGKSIPGSNSSVVEIFEISNTGFERGEYHVKVENQTGPEFAVESAPLFLETQTAPQILSIDYPDSIVAPGNTIEILSLASGYNLSFQWKKDGVDLQGFTTSALEIPQAQSGDSGNYQLEVSNDFGTVASQLINIQVEGLAPVITQQLVDSVVPIGGTIQLSVDAIHPTGELMIFSWYKDGSLMEAEGPELLITDATESDMGSYQVVVSSQSGTVYSKIVEIESPSLPKILRHPSSSNVIAGQAVDLSVRVESDQRSGEISYQWYQNSVAIPGATSSSLNKIITPVEGIEAGTDINQLPTSGSYYKPAEGVFMIYVEVTNNAGKVVSGVAAVVVADDLLDLAESGEIEEIQTFSLRPGWNAIHLKVQPDNAYIDDLLTNVPWTSVWRYKNRKGAAQFIEDLSESDWDNPEWLVRFASTDENGDPNPHVFANNLIKFRRDDAYLIHVSEAEAINYTLSVKGVVAPTSAPWVPDSYNLRGFPVSTQAVKARDLFQQDAALWDSSKDEPRALYRLTAEGIWARMTGDDIIQSGEAYWIYSTGAVQKPFTVAVDLDFGDTMKFGSNVDERLVTLTNYTDTDRIIYITLGPVGVQEEIPFELGQDEDTYVAPSEEEVNPDLNETTGLGNVSPISVYLPTVDGLQPISLNDFNQIQLAPGEVRVLNFKVNREMIPAQGWENKLYFTDTLVEEKLGMEVAPRSQVGTDPAILSLNGQEALGSSAAANQPAGANSYQLASLSSSAGNPLLKGLWFGQITISAVSQVNGYDVIRTERSITNSLGAVTNIVEISYEAQNGSSEPAVTSAPLEVGMLVHHDGSQTVLLNEVFFMREPTSSQTQGEFRLISNRNLIGNYEGVSLQGRQKVGRRISSIAFPLPEPDRQKGFSVFNGSMAPGQSMEINLSMDSDDPLNPYKHKYHPDHDNLSANFKTFSEESYPILRTIELSFNAGGLAQDSKSGSETLTGVFEEEINYLHRNPIILRGTVEWIRISPLEDIISE